MCEFVRGARNEVRRNVSRTQLEWLAVHVAADPLRVMTGCHRNIRVSELGRHVSELNACREQAACVRIAQILVTTVSDSGPLKNSSPLPSAKIRGVKLTPSIRPES